MSPFLDINKIDNFIATYSTKKNIVEFYGGEPTLHKDLIFETIKLINDKHSDKEFSYRLYTNGVFKDYSVDEIKFIASNIDEILLSLDGFDYEDNTKRFTSIDEYNSVINNLKVLISNDANVGISSVLYNMSNYSKIYDNYKKFFDIGVRYFSYEPLTIFQTDKAVVIPKKFMKAFTKNIYKVVKDISDNDLIGEVELFVAKELLSSSWYNNGEKTQCSKWIRALSPRGNIYMCRDHAANEEEMFFSPKVIQFFNKNNLKIDNGSFPFVEQNENNLTLCSVKNIQYRDLKIDDKLYWLDDEWQDLIIRPLYQIIMAIDVGDKSIKPYIEKYISMLPAIFERLKI
jgi:sulfatase maturation enzyme AslB (radical SAM superfamily)